MNGLSIEIREYFSSGDDCHRASILERYPDLKETLREKETRSAILDWLATDEAHAESFTELVFNLLEYIRVGVSENEVSTIRPFLLNPNPAVRLRSYEVLLTLYFPDKNKEALFVLLHSMLSDDDEMIRAQAVNYIERANATKELLPFLERWRKMAIERGWSKKESFELVERLLQD